MKSWFARGLVLAAGIYFLWRVFLPSLAAMTHSFPAYYTAARLVLERQWSAQAYDDTWFGARVLALTDGRISERISMNPPTTALLFLPIAWLDLTTARIVWQGLNLALLLLIFWLLRAIVHAEHSQWFRLFTALGFLFPPLLENFRVGQVYVVLLFLFCLTLWQAQHARAVGAGLALGAALAVKLSGAPLLLLWVRHREWRALWVACATAAAIACVSAFVLGSEGWFAFFQRALDYTRAPLAAHVAYQTTPSFFQRLFGMASAFNPEPLWSVPWLATLLNLLVSIAALGVTFWLARDAALEIAFATCVTVSVILFPLASEYHYTLMLLPLAVLCARVIETRQRVDMVWLAIVFVLFYLPIDWNMPQWNAREFVLFAYPRLYGGWLLWLWLLKQMWLPNTATVSGLPSNATR